MQTNHPTCGPDINPATKECTSDTDSVASNDTDVTLSVEEKKQPYSAFTYTEKWAIVIMASLAGVFSPLTSNIYFPAIPTLAHAFGKSVELINLTVTMYMVLQGIAPMFWGTLADHWGRRPMFLACLLVLPLSCIGLALVPTNAYWLLMLLRCLQAAGSASTIALGAGVIGDISTRAERGGFVGIYSLGPLLGPCIGPIIGGALAGALGWRAIFWFLSGGSALCFIAVLCFLPETLHSIVGNGSIKPPPVYLPLVPVIGRNQAEDEKQQKPPQKTLTYPFRILLQLDVAIILFFNAVLYSVFYGITTSISSLLSDAYPFLSELDIGLCFLPLGTGMIIGSCLSGKRLDREYQNVKRSLEEKARNDTEGKIKPVDVTKDENFPIEYARYRSVPIFYVVFVVACVGYGWCLHQKVHFAIPLVLQMILGFCIVNMTNTASTLLVDLLPNQSGSVTACNNLVRCSLGAACVSAVDPIIGSIGVGWTYTVLAGICVAVSPLMFVIMRVGPRWRARRASKQTAS